MLSIALSGSSGLVGAALTQSLRAEGARVLPIVRRAGTDAAIRMDVAANTIDTEKLEGLDAVVHLAGENIAGRWTDAKKRAIRDSRVQGTALLARTLSSLKQKPRVFICASATGIYGERGDERLDESSPPGAGFLADVCKEWEAAARPALDAGIRVVHTRIGVVLARNGGALSKMLLPFKLGLGGVFGGGTQYWSWIALDDVVGALQFALKTEALRGPVNLTAPVPATNREFTKTLGSVLSRPTIFPVPAFAAKLALGEMAQELLLTSTRAEPRLLRELGYKFIFPELRDALEYTLKKE